MKRFVPVCLVVVCLALPAVAHEREDRGPRRDPERTPIQRAIKALKKFGATVLSWDITVPKP